MKKFIAILMASVLVLSLTIPVFAHDWPENVEDWDDDDWEAWENYWDDYYDHHDYYPDEDCDEDWDKYWDNYWDEYWRKHHDKYHNNYNNYNNNNYQPNANYSGYNFYSGILDVYDASTENQATVLARIINIYAHGVSSRAQQAAVGWAVLNSVDASSRGVNICTVAPNFNYDYGNNVTDDYGRNLLPLARDIIFRWKAGRAGISNNGRVLPSGYYYVASTGSAVAFGSTPNEARSFQSFGYTSPYGN